MLDRGRLARLGLLLQVAATLLVAGACSTAAFYSQGIRGGLEILRQRRSIAAVLTDPSTSEELRVQLGVVLKARDFAAEQLGLPSGGSFRHYTDVGRAYAVWNVVAAPELSVVPLSWCFPFAGCVTYRGYFSESRARRFADRLQRRGFDVQVAGVATYSTLGWFRDPVLSTYVDLPPARLAAVLFHELAHQRLYLPGDTTFNESFASLVEEEGVRRWLDARGEGAAREAYRLAERRRREVAQLLQRYRDRLAGLYSRPLGPEEMRRRKAGTFDELRADYRRLRRTWDGYAGYDAFFTGRLNNAHLAAVGAYDDHLPAFRRLLQRCEGELPCFYGAAEILSRLPPQERRRRLLQLAGTDSAVPSS